MTKNPTRQQLLDLASDVRKAGHLEFFRDHGDREPDGSRLSGRGQQWIAEALEYWAKHDKRIKP